MLCILRYCDVPILFACSEGYQHRASRSSYDATSRAFKAQQDPQANMQKHFDSIQKISDSTTLPQMLIELERGLDRAANVDVLISELRCVPCKTLGLLSGTRMQGACLDHPMQIEQLHLFGCR